MYTKALFDIKWALQFKHNARTMLQMQMERKDCEKRLMSVDCIDGHVPPKMNYPNDNHFPCMANVLEIRENEKFGRHIIAKEDIEVGKVVMVPDIFASATTSDTLTTCRTCNQIERNFVACADCSNTMFCRGSCFQESNVHRLECGSIYHMIDANLQLPIQTLLLAINEFSTLAELQVFVEQFVCLGSERGIPKAANDFKSKYALFLTLTRRNCSELIYLSYQVFTTLMTFPRVKRLVNNVKEMLFVIHLTLHHVAVIARNSFRFQSQQITSGSIKSSYIYDVMSLFNHSCSPNLFNFCRPDDISYCIVVKPIRAGEQMFINYLGNSGSMALDERRTNLAHWNFICECERCEYEKKHESSPIKSIIASDSAFQYVKEVCLANECRLVNWECGKRSLLKKQCVKFLGEFGHMNWTPEIQTVVDCYTLH